jgi:hypothetical protein
MSLSAVGVRPSWLITNWQCRSSDMYIGRKLSGKEEQV